MTIDLTAPNPSITLNSGVTMPALGLGVFQTPPEETAAAVTEALRAGYRHVDTAAAYGNEREVGQALRDSDVDRSEVFLETKLWISDYGYEPALHGFEKSAAKLGVEQVDLLLLHQPLTSEFESTIDAYKALQTLLADGRVRAIGISNVMPDVLERLMAEVEVAPAVNQVESHPYFAQRDVQVANDCYGILTQAWSPIGGITHYRGDSERSTFTDPVIGQIAAAHGRTPAQVMLRWGLQQGRSVIPKSVRPERIAENLDVFGFALSDEELSRIDALETGERGDLRGVSTEVLDALARTLLLDEAETDHLHDLAEAAGPPARRRRRPAEQPFPDSLQRFVDAVAVPVGVRDRRMDVVATNSVGRALYVPVLEDPAAPGSPSEERLRLLGSLAQEAAGADERADDGRRS